MNNKGKKNKFYFFLKVLLLLNTVKFDQLIAFVEPFFSFINNMPSPGTKEHFNHRRKGVQRTPIASAFSIGTFEATREGGGG